MTEENTIEQITVGEDGVESNSKCYVCYGDLVQGEDASTLVCNHTFHSTCINLWFAESNTCPLCRRVLGENRDGQRSSNEDLSADDEDFQDSYSLDGIGDEEFSIPSDEETDQYDDMNAEIDYLSDDSGVEDIDMECTLHDNIEFGSFVVGIELAPQNWIESFTEFFAGAFDVISSLSDSENSLPSEAAYKDDFVPSFFITEEDLHSSPRCSVCFEELRQKEVGSKLVCGHLFHTGCIVPWLQRRGTCPICRREQGNCPPQCDNSTVDDEETSSLNVDLSSSNDYDVEISFDGEDTADSVFISDTDPLANDDGGSDLERDSDDEDDEERMLTDEETASLNVDLSSSNDNDIEISFDGEDTADSVFISDTDPLTNDEGGSDLERSDDEDDEESMLTDKDTETVEDGNDHICYMCREALSFLLENPTSDESDSGAILDDEEEDSSDV